nr:tyrosine-type recombinase/integrase [uncultured Pseudomonas sp.]
MRPRKKDRHLPACMYEKHGAYYLVKKGKWTRLDSDFQVALLAYARHMMAPPEGAMAALIDKVLKHHCQGLAANTCEQYKQAAERLKDMLAEIEPHDVMPRHVAAIKMDLSDTPNMCNRILSFLRIVFQYALEWQLVDSNPCTGIRRHAEKKRDRYITDAEFRALMSHCSDYMRCIFELAYLTGQRISDVLSIRYSDISDEGIEFTQKKTGAKLIVLMTPDIKKVLDDAKALPRKVRGLTLFCTRGGGKPVSYATVKDAFARARTAAGIQNVKIHDLRAKSLTDADGEGKDAQKLGGHSDRRMTARYIRGRKHAVAQAPNMPKNNDEY